MIELNWHIMCKAHIRTGHGFPCTQVSDLSFVQQLSHWLQIWLQPTKCSRLTNGPTLGLLGLHPIPDFSWIHFFLPNIKCPVDPVWISCILKYTCMKSFVPVHFETSWQNEVLKQSVVSSASPSIPAPHYSNSTIGPWILHFSAQCKEFHPLKRT